MKNLISSALLISFLASLSQSALAEQTTPGWTTDVTQTTFLQQTGFGLGFVTVWGATNWDYFSKSAHSQSEGWFEKETPHGGADKMGHIFSGYTLSRFLSYRFANRQNPLTRPALMGAFSSFLILGYMEIGDSFSDYGFSEQDFFANTIGCVMGYLAANFPMVDRRFDFRWEYGLRPNQGDILTDYDNSRYALVARLHGFDLTAKTPAKYLELQYGYYTRGFDSQKDPDRRFSYVGLGLNLSHLLEKQNFQKTSTAVRYMQVPGLYLAAKEELGN